MKRSIPVLFSFGRSGGTLLNQLLGTHPDCYILSEVNPAASFVPIAEQAEKWLHLVEASHIDEFLALPYAKKIECLDDRAKTGGKRLFVRDFTSVNFVARCVPHVYPSGVLEQEFYLRQAGFEIIPFVIARRGYDVYSSWKSSFEQFRTMTANSFADSYSRYAAAVRKYPVLHLEQLQADPESAVALVLKRFGLDEKWQSHMLKNFHSFTKCSGNNTLTKPSRSAKAKTILQIPRDRHAADLINDAAASAELAKADEWLGYD